MNPHLINHLAKAQIHDRLCDVDQHHVTPASQRPRSPRPLAPLNPGRNRSWMILAVLGTAQLMVVLDATVVNIALPSAQRTLHFSNDSRQWILTAYALAFGSLLLLGGRLSDWFGRKWTLITGLAGFAVASAAGGAAQSFAMLVGARACQGAFAALLAPAALSLLTTTFTEPAERARAFGVFAAIAGSGSSIGLLLGGLLTQVAELALQHVRQSRVRVGRGCRCAGAHPQLQAPDTPALGHPRHGRGVGWLVRAGVRLLACPNHQVGQPGDSRDADRRLPAVGGVRRPGITDCAPASSAACRRRAQPGRVVDVDRHCRR